MKAVTIRQPWAWAIASGFKDIENRSWAPRIEPGDLLAIHAAVAAPDEDKVVLVQKRIGRRAQVPGEFDCGAIVAIARVAKVVTSSRSVWFNGPLGWVLEDVISLPEPIECKGQLGLWTVPPDVEARVRRQTRPHAGRARRGSGVEKRSRTSA